MKLDSVNQWSENMALEIAKKSLKQESFSKLFPLKTFRRLAFLELLSEPKNKIRIWVGDIDIVMICHKFFVRRLDHWTY